MDWPSVRRIFHRYPEISGKEESTAKRVVDILRDYPSFTVETAVGGHGVLAIQRNGDKGPSLLLRAELDALPITEKNTFNHSSTRAGYMHACGHDGHLTTLLALAHLLEQDPPSAGSIYLLFQPAEETGEGAAKVLADPRFNNVAIDQAIAWHNLPGFPLHQILVKPSLFTASVESIAFSLEGKTAHAGQPETGWSPAGVLSECLAMPSAFREQGHQLTEIYASMGEKAYGTAPGKAEVHYTYRAETEEAFQRVKDKLIQSVKNLSRKQNIRCTHKTFQRFYSCVNTKALVDSWAAFAKAENFDVVFRDQAFRWGEDFGLFTQRYPGFFFGVGAGLESPDLHHPNYDFNDALIEPMSRLLYRYISTQCKEYEG